MPEASLAIESSQREASVAVRARPGAPVREVPVPAPEADGDHLMAMIDRSCRDGGVRPADIGMVAVSCGPGGFTGLRVACATAKALAEVTGCRLVAVPSALSAARAAVRAGELADGACLVVLAGKGTDAWCTEVEVVAGMPRLRSEGLRDSLPDGRGTVLADAHLPEAWVARARERGLLAPRWSASACLEVGEALAADGSIVDSVSLLPSYPRPPEAVTLWEARNRGR